jgi:transposase
VVLWNRHLLAELLRAEFGVSVGDSTVSLHLRQLGLSYRSDKSLELMILE